MVSGSLALLYFLLSFHGGRQGSGPDRGLGPIEWGSPHFIGLHLLSGLLPKKRKGEEKNKRN